MLYNFHPVGQGLFSSGRIAPVDGNNKSFWWVFDCGTYLKSHYALRDAEIDDLKAKIGPHSAKRRPRLDIVFISHFDKDHVNGLLKLLEEFEVGRLVLPFIPLHERLLIAFSGKAVKWLHPWQFFITAPSRYIQRSVGIQVERLTFVSPSGSAGPLSDGDPQPWDGDPLEIVPPPSELPEELYEFDNIVGAGIRVEWLSEGSSLKVGNAWEFVPYNDSSTVLQASPVFRQQAKLLAEQMIMTTCKADRAKIQDQIVKLYEAHHGTSALKKNLISLFVYAGPLFKPKWRSNLVDPSCDICQLLFLHDVPYCHCSMDCRVCLQGTHAILYTGDGSLKTRNQLSKMLSYFGGDRIEQINVVQVMHHGSKGSWHKGVARELAPEHSIFCAYQPGLYRHPHYDVWDDFKNYGPRVCGVNQRERFRLRRLLLWI